MKVRELERQITAVRRELACALDDYRELGLQVSLLSKQRNIARQNLARTKQYLQSVQPGLTPQRRDDQAIPISAAANGARPSSRQARATGPVRRSSLHRRVQWRRAVASIASHAVPARQLERELGQLQQQLAASRDECSQLEDYAERLERERDQALADLELARAQALSLANVESAAQTPVEAETPAAEPREVASLGDAFRAAEEKLQREQHAKNDIQIALAEREDQVAALQSERNGLQSEVAQLKVCLSGLQEELSAARQSGQTVLSELRVLRDDSHRTTTQDAERLRALQRRIGEMEARLEAAHGRSEALEQDLATAAARQAETEHQREQLAQALEQERSNSTAQNRELADLQAQDEQRRAEIETLARQLAAASEEQETVRAENGALEQQLATLTSELESARSGEQRTIQDLQQRLAVTEPERDAALQRVEALAAALQAEKDRLDERERQLAALEAHQQQLAAEAEDLKRQMSTAEQSRARAEQEAQVLRPELDERVAQLNTLQAALGSASGRIAEAEQRHRGLSDELQKERNRVSEREQQLSKVQAREAQLQGELEALQQDREALVDEYAAGRRHDAQRIEDLEQDLEAAAARQAETEQQREQLAEALAEERSSSAARERELADLQGQEQTRRPEIDSLRHQLAGARQEFKAVTATLRSVEVTLQRVQGEKNDSAIALTERDDEIAALQSEVEQLKAHLSALQQELDTAQQSSQALAAELDAVRDELHRTGSRDGEQIAALQRRIAETEAEQQRRLEERDRRLTALQDEQQQLLAEAKGLKRQLAEARQGRARGQQEQQTLKQELDELIAQLKPLQAALASAEARIAEIEQQRQSLSDELSEERNRGAQREQQLGETRARERQLQDELEAVARQLSGVEQELVTSTERIHSLEQDKQALVVEYAATRAADREHISTLGHRLEELESELSNVRHENETLQLSLAEAAYRQEVSDRRISELGEKLEGADQARESAAVAEWVAPEAEAAGAMPGTALQPVPVVTAAPVRRRRLRRWGQVAAGLLLVAGIVASAVKLRDLLWYRQPVTELSSVPEAGTSERPQATVGALAPGAPDETPDEGLTQSPAGASTAGATSASATGPARVAVADPAKDAPAKAPGPATTLQRKEMAPYLRSLSKQTTEPAPETVPKKAEVVASAGRQAEAVPRAATRKNAQSPLVRVLRKRTADRAGAGGGPVEAYLMEDAATARAVKKLCEGAAAGEGACSEIEQGFMKDTVLGLPSGVKYKVIRNGRGRSPHPGQTVVVSYSGLLPDGTEFDSSGQGGAAEAFRLSQAIPGLQDVLQYMEEGAKWEVYLPTELAFPEPGPLGGQEVIFVIELLAVLDTEVSDAAAANGNDQSPLPTRPPGGEESYWQTATGGETGEAEAEQASDLGPVRLSPLEQHFETEQFLAENAKREDVVSLPSGLQYRVLKSGGGSGRSPSTTDTVVIKYRGTLPDGREFDRSEGAAEFSLQEVIPGWQEALQQMEEGAEWELYIPPSLAHKGATRRRGALGQQPLIYQVELVSINQGGQAPADE